MCCSATAACGLQSALLLVVVVSIRRALIDSNVSRYLVDAGVVEDLRRAARRSGVTIVASPAVLYEALRTSNADVRRRVVKAITRREWEWPMPEVYSECEAVVTEIRRVRPEWIRPEARPS